MDGVVTGTKVVAIIPARGGSKTIPGKNIKLLGGIPLIAYSIAAGLQAKKVDRVIVSTDDEKIAKVARSYGAEVPFMRPSELAQDKTADLPVFKHALDWFRENENYIPDLLVQLRPTSPFRPKESVDRAVDLLLKDDKASCVRTVVPSGQNPYKMWRFDAGEYMKPLLDVTGVKEPYNAPRQQLPETYWQTGHIDAIRPTVILEKDSMSGECILPLILDQAYAVDIDTEFDWSLAEWCLENIKLPIVRP